MLKLLHKPAFEPFSINNSYCCDQIRKGKDLPSTLFVVISGSSISVSYDSPIAAIQHRGAKIPPRTIIPKNRKALYWVGASHPVSKVNQPAYTIPARPLVGYSQTDINRFKDLIFKGIADHWKTQL
jgi:hypothetical protein